MANVDIQVSGDKCRFVIHTEDGIVTTQRAMLLVIAMKTVDIDTVSDRIVYANPLTSPLVRGYPLIQSRTLGDEARTSSLQPSSYCSKF